MARGSIVKPTQRVSRASVVAFFISAAAGVPSAGAAETSTSPGAGILSPGRMFSEETGESLYRNVCQGCHMGDGRGSVGAGSYPSLAGDPNLEPAAFPVHVVVNGLRGMPAFGHAMTDEQVIAVVSYVRMHFGNRDATPVTADEVRAARQD